jgi:Fe-S-cluster-containing dehydrogenase component
MVFLDGVPRERYLRLNRADVVVSFGADLLGAHPNAVSYMREWAERRREQGGKDVSWVQIESSLSLTGAAADSRWLSSPGEVAQAALWLLRHVAEGTTHSLSASIVQALSGLPVSSRAEEVARLAVKVLEARERAAIETDSDDVGVQLAVALMNRVLGAEEHAVSLVSAPHLRVDGDAALISLMDRVRSGEVKKLILLACDPVDDLPFGAELAKILPSLGLSLCLSERRTASAQASHMVGSIHHFLESWGDARSPDGVTLSLMQPAVMPLFDTRHPLDLLLQLGDLGTDYYAYLRASWRQHVFPSVAGSVKSFEHFWTEALRVGVAPAGADYVVQASAISEATSAVALPVLLNRLAEVVTKLAAARVDLFAELISQPGIMDGARLHVPWLREMPEPLTRVSWTPVARIAPKLAKDRSISNGDVLTLTVQGKEVSLPACILPGQHPEVVGIPIGFGRVDADSLSEHNALRLLSSNQGVLRRTALPLTISKSEQNSPLPLVQIESSSHGRPIIFQVHDDHEHVHGHEPHTPGLWPKSGKPSPQWEMVIDLDRCTGCGACVVACQAENNLPSVGPEEIRRNRDMAWLRIDRYFVGKPDNPQVLFQPMLCSQCGNAPCETVCPALATMHSADGLNQQAYNRCVGTRYCANNCPYKVRRFNWFKQDFGPPVERLVLNPDVVVRDRGVMEKCTFCVQRIQSARIASRIQDQTSFTVQTACSQSCPAGAIIFGDASDPNGPIAALKQSPRAFRVLADLGVDPSITYLAHVRRSSSDPSLSDKG